jgi:RNA polymerase sigma-70 factor (ECF subfamily)
MERNRGKHLAEIEVRLRELLISACAGSDTDYLIFLKEITSHIRGYFKKRLPDFTNDVEDLVQETLIAVHSHRHTYQTSQPLTAWMYAIARYKMVDWLRRRSSGTLTIPIEDAQEVLDDSDSLATDARIDIEGILSGLPDRFRLPIMYVKLKGLSVAEAASLTGMTESAIKIGIHRGMKELVLAIRGRP